MLFSYTTGANKSGWRDSNARSHAPKACALDQLGYTPNILCTGGRIRTHVRDKALSVLETDAIGH